ncbi:MAG TPA: hypothetical protein VJX66_08005 [Amycolatopsis sp.]|nr:hypothetical protein [Amycolatopsis sp.]
MKHEWRDAVATLAVLFVIALYVDYLVDGAALWIHGPRVMTLTAVGLGVTAAVFGGWTATTKWAQLISAPLGAAALVLAIGILSTGNEVALAVFIGLVVLLWAISTIRHFRLPAGRT